MNSYWYYFAMAASVIVASLSQIILKKSAMKQYNSFIREYLNLYVITGYGMMFLSMLLTIFVYSGLPYKNVPIVEAFGYILVMFLSAVFFKEKVTNKKIWGTTLIIAGVVIYYMNPTI